MLTRLRMHFVNELSEHVDAIADKFVSLVKCSTDRALFNDLFRMVRRLQVSGGTCGSQILCHICHVGGRHARPT